MSPVHDQSYRRYQGPRVPAGRAWLVILRQGLRALGGRKVFIALLLASWLPFLVRSVQIYLVTTYPQAADLLAVDMRMFQQFVEQQGVFAFFVTIYAGAGLIASDRRARALQLYLSKPLLRMEYIGGKLGILVVYLSLVTVVPGLLLLVMQIALSGSLAFVVANPAVVPAVLVGSSLRVVVPAVTMLALSSVSTSARYAAVLYAGVAIFSEAVYGVLFAITRSSALVLVSFGGNFDVVTDAIFRQPPRYDAPVPFAMLVLAALVAGGLFVVRRQVRGVEVVS